MEKEDLTTRNLHKELDAAARKELPFTESPQTPLDRPSGSVLTLGKGIHPPCLSNLHSFEFPQPEYFLKGPSTPSTPQHPPTSDRMYTKEEVQAMITAAIKSHYSKPPPQDNKPKRDPKKNVHEWRAENECDSYSASKEGGSQDVRTKVDSLQRDINKLKALRRGVKRVCKATSPFIKDIDDDSIPSNYRSIPFEYNSTTDPIEHLSRFSNTASLHQLTEEVKCRAFVTTLTRAAQAWLGMLPQGSIHSFSQFAKGFINQFASSKKCKKTSLSLFSIRQKEKESLRNYIKRFTSGTLEVLLTSDEVLMAALSQGLRDDEFFCPLALEASPDFDDLLIRAAKFINLEEARQHKVEESNHIMSPRPTA